MRLASGPFSFAEKVSSARERKGNLTSVTDSSAKQRRWNLPNLPEWSWVRDRILFFGGLLGVVHQAVFAAEVEWELLLIFGAMMGLPLPLRADEARRNGDG